MKRHSGQRGFALLIVLWSLALLTLLGTVVLRTARQDTQLARNLLDAAELEAAANGAVQQAIFNMLDSSNGHWNADGITHTIRVGRFNVAVRIENEADKINPNLASVELLQALLIRVGADAATAAAISTFIAEWRSTGSVAAQTNSMTARNAAAGRDSVPSGAQFTNLDELGVVRGMTPALFTRLLPHMTVYTDDDPNASTRDPIVAQALAAVGVANAGDIEGIAETVSIFVNVHGSGNAHFALREVVRTNARAAGRRYDILDYARLWND